MTDLKSRPRLESTYFGGEGSEYARMARVLAYTARKHCPDWIVNVRATVPEPVHGTERSAYFIANTQKLDLWCRTVDEAAEGDRMVLMDADTYFENGIDDVWDREFDIAYTVRPEYIIPINTGAVFVRVTPGTRAFMQRWREETAAMYADVPHHLKWKEKYGGITQASLGCLLERGGHGLNLHTLPCTEWNCEDSAWGRYDPAVTRIVHIKSGLRRLIFNGDVGHAQHPWWTNEDLAPLAARWLAVEREAEQAEAAAAPPASDQTPAAPAGAAPFQEVFA
ncbi:MAG TPA: hypothetical protein VF665_12690 [Longimicrobium sp.]|jgi:hypothetical protein|uniref:hypothetical protein n=1 Tax=Longimicrobium sp. TaxID=2029185 RepID=UPI002EDA9EBF